MPNRLKMPFLLWHSCQLSNPSSGVPSCAKMVPTQYHFAKWIWKSNAGASTNLFFIAFQGGKHALPRFLLWGTNKWTENMNLWPFFHLLVWYGEISCFLIIRSLSGSGVSPLFFSLGGNQNKRKTGKRKEKKNRIFFVGGGNEKIGCTFGHIPPIFRLLAWPIAGKLFGAISNMCVSQFFGALGVGFRPPLVPQKIKKQGK